MLRTALISALLACAFPAHAAYTPVKPHGEGHHAGPRVWLEYFRARELHLDEFRWDGAPRQRWPRRDDDREADGDDERHANPYWRHRAGRQEGGRRGHGHPGHGSCGYGRHGHSHAVMRLCDEPYEPMPPVPLPGALASFALGLGVIAGALGRRRAA